MENAFPIPPKITLKDTTFQIGKVLLVHPVQVIMQQRLACDSFG